MSETIDDLKSTARRVWAEIMPANDASALRELIHEEYVDRDARPDEPPGAESVVRTMRWLHGVFADLAFDVHQVIGDGDTVAVHCTLTGRHTGDLMGIAPTGRPVATPMVHILRFRDGKAIEHWAVHDDLATMRQLGVLPARPPVAAAG